MRIVHPRTNSMLLIAAVTGVIAGSVPAGAFMESEDQQFQADINEAKARAQDFERTLKRIERDDQEREAAGSEVGPKREREATEREEIRRDFVLERDRRPDETWMRENLEKEDLKQKEIEAQVMEANRREYVAKRDRVRRVIGREAYIDEAREYGL